MERQSHARELQGCDRTSVFDGVLARAGIVFLAPRGSAIRVSRVVEAVEEPVAFGAGGAVGRRWLGVGPEPTGVAEWTVPVSKRVRPCRNQFASGEVAHHQSLAERGAAAVSHPVGWFAA